MSETPEAPLQVDPTDVEAVSINPEEPDDLVVEEGDPHEDEN